MSFELDATGHAALTLTLTSDAPPSVVLEGEGVSKLHAELTFTKTLLQVDMPAVYRGMQGERGEKGEVGDSDELPDFTLIFDNVLVG